LHDDGIGVGEPLDEREYSAGLLVRGKHYVITGTNGGASPSFAAQEKQLVQRKLLPPWTFFSPTEHPLEDWLSRFTMKARLIFIYSSFLFIWSTFLLCYSSVKQLEKI